MSHDTVKPELDPADSAWEGALRPERLGEYVGQQKVKDNLSVFIEAARARNGLAGRASP